MSDEKKSKNKGFEAAKEWLTTKSSKEIYDEFLNKNTTKQEVTLLGIYNITNQEITLIPCIRDRVVLIYNEDKEFIGGWLIKSQNNKLLKLRDLLDNEIEEYNELGSAPRFLISKKDYDLDPDQATTIFDDNRITAHEYLIQIKGVEQNIADYRGFAVIPREDPHYYWTSGSLNSPRDSQGNITVRINSAKMNGMLQKEVQDKIGAWTGRPSFMNLEPLVNELESYIDLALENPAVLQATEGRIEIDEQEEQKKFAQFKASSTIQQEDDMDNFLDELIDPPKSTLDINPANPGVSNNQSFAVEIETDISIKKSDKDKDLEPVDKDGDDETNQTEQNKSTTSLL